MVTPRARVLGAILMALAITGCARGGAKRRPQAAHDMTEGVSFTFSNCNQVEGKGGRCDDADRVLFYVHGLHGIMDTTCPMVKTGGHASNSCQWTATCEEKGYFATPRTMTAVTLFLGDSQFSLGIPRGYGWIDLADEDNMASLRRQFITMKQLGGLPMYRLPWSLSRADRTRYTVYTSDDVGGADSNTADQEADMGTDMGKALGDEPVASLVTKVVEGETEKEKMVRVKFTHERLVPPVSQDFRSALTMGDLVVQCNDRRLFGLNERIVQFTLPPRIKHGVIANEIFVDRAVTLGQLAARVGVKPGGVLTLRPLDYFESRYMEWAESHGVPREVVGPDVFDHGLDVARVMHEICYGAYKTSYDLKACGKSMMGPPLCYRGSQDDAARLKRKEGVAAMCAEVTNWNWGRGNTKPPRSPYLTNTYHYHGKPLPCEGAFDTACEQKPDGSPLHMHFCAMASPYVPPVCVSSLHRHFQLPFLQTLFMAEQVDTLGAYLEKLAAMDEQAESVVEGRPNFNLRDSIRDNGFDCGAAMTMGFQGTCGSCASFAATAAYAARLCVMTEGRIQSRPSAADVYSLRDDVGDLSVVPQSKQSGYPWKIFYRMAKGRGVLPEICRPYVCTKDKGESVIDITKINPRYTDICKRDNPGLITFHTERGAPVELIGGIESGYPRVVKDIMEALEDGPISTEVPAPTRFRSVGFENRAGYFDYNRNTFLETGYVGVKSILAFPVDHAVNLVGWGSDGKHRYWRLQNSWGANWGISGTGEYLMSRGFDRECLKNSIAQDYAANANRECHLDFLWSVQAGPRGSRFVRKGLSPGDDVLGRSSLVIPNIGKTTMDQLHHLWNIVEKQEGLAASRVGEYCRHNGMPYEDTEGHVSCLCRSNWQGSRCETCSAACDGERWRKELDKEQCECRCPGGKWGNRCHLSATVKICAVDGADPDGGGVVPYEVYLVEKSAGVGPTGRGHSLVVKVRDDNVRDAYYQEVGNPSATNRMSITRNGKSVKMKGVIYGSPSTPSFKARILTETKNEFGVSVFNWQKISVEPCVKGQRLHQAKFAGRSTPLGATGVTHVRIHRGR